MPRCRALTQLPGIAGPIFDLSASSGSADLDIEFGSGLLQLPSGQSLRMRAVFDAVRSVLTLSATPAPALALVGGELRLLRLELSLRLRTDSNGEWIWDEAANDGLVADGAVEWRGHVPALCGAPGEKIDLVLQFARGGGTEGFVLALAATTVPLRLSRLDLAVEALSVGVAVETTPSGPVLVLRAEGRTKLEGATATAARQLLQRIFGNTALPSALSFRVVQRLALDGAGRVGGVIGAPEVGFGFDWPTVPSLPTVPELRVSVGRPFFHWSLPALDRALPDLGFQLTGSEITFPDLPEMNGITLQGDLVFASLPNGGSVFRFLPRLRGELNLPPLLRLFLSRIRWGAIDLPRLDDLPEAVRLTLGDLDFLRTLEGLTPPAGLSGPALAQWVSGTFRPEFRLLLDAMNALPGAPRIERLLSLAFDSFVEPLLLDVLWQEWLDRVASLGDLVTMLLARLDDVSENSIRRLFSLLQTLTRQSRFEFGAVVSAVLEAVSGNLIGLAQRGILLLTALLAAAVQVAGPNGISALAGSLLRLLKDESRPAGRRALMGLGDLPFLAGFPRLASANLKVPLDSLLVGLGLHLVVGISAPAGLEPFFRLPKTHRFLEFVFAPAFDLFKQWQGLWPRLDATMIAPLLVALVTNAKDDPESERVLLQMGRAFPPLGLLLAGVALLASVARGGLNLVGDTFNRTSSSSPGPVNAIEEIPNLKVRRLPAPGKVGGKSIKYLILSDVHRDSRDDDRGAFAFGSIEHFRNHQDLYAEVLDYATAQGFTVIENGDCEELWFIRDFATWKGPRDKVQKVIADHAPIYDRLKVLHDQGRYFRNYGNHDSYLRDPRVREPLIARFEGAVRPSAVPAFEIHDYLIIDGIKTMDEHGLLSAIGEMGEAIGELGRQLPLEQRLERAGREVTRGHLGLDATDYVARKPLIVTHGHQWDIANCDANNLVGKLIANSIGVPADMLNDPLEDLRGIALGGSPFLDFRDALASWPVFDNFPSEQPAVGFAHAMQHMPNRDRLLTDSFIYQESIAALAGLFTLAVSVPTTAGMRKWSDAKLGEMPEHLFNLLAIGHTHNPHNQPYFPIESMLSLPIVGQLMDAVRDAAAEVTGIEFSLNFLKSRLLNSGTAGWMEGVVWGLQIEEDGQAHLVFWTRNTRIDQPNRMDWELYPLPPSQRAALNALGSNVAEWWANALRLGGDSAQELIKRLTPAMSFAALLRIAPEIEAQASAAPLQLADEDPSAAIKLTGWLTTVFMGMMRRRLIPATGATSLVLNYTLPAELADQLSSAQNFLSGVAQMPSAAVNAEAMLRAALSWLAMKPRSLLPAKNAKGESDFPLAEMLFALMPLLQGGGGGMPVVAVSLTGRDLRVNLTFN